MRVKRTFIVLSCFIGGFPAGGFLKGDTEIFVKVRCRSGLTGHFQYKHPLHVWLGSQTQKQPHLPLKVFTVDLYLECISLKTRLPTDPAY